MINVVIGKDSSLTKELKKSIKNLIILSSRDENLLNEIQKLNKFRKFNLIFNNFYPSKFLSKFDSNYGDFYHRSLIINTNILKKINFKKINKIIYTSSSAVYGFSNEDYILNENINKKIYSSIKVANENLFISFCIKNKIQYIITRLFNLYGSSSDSFSIISKLISASKSNNKITIYNNGRSVRDFIHVKDVAYIYKVLLNQDFFNGILDIGTGCGVKIKDLLDFIGKDIIRFNFSDKLNDETLYSVANVQKLKSIIQNYKFIKLDYFLKKKLKIKKNNNRFNYLSYFDNNFSKNLDVRIIYGAGNAGIQAYKKLTNNDLRVSYFVDDNSKLHNGNLFGIPIISYNDLKNLSKKIKIKSILIAIPSLNKNKINNLIKKINAICSNIEVLPNKKNLISDTINLSDITSPIINNILNRKEIFFKKSYFNYLYKKNILITGGGGSIGSELFRQLTLLKVGKIVALDNSEISIYNLKKNRSESTNLKYILGDISDDALIGKIIKDNKIDIIFHAAAYKHVPILENNLIAAVKNNIIGTINVLKNSLKFNCNFIFVSTDKAVRPCSNLGITKRIAEIICQGYKNNKKNSKINIVRFGNVFGSVGSAIPLFLEQINNNLPITITDRRVKRYFMTIKEACLLLLVSARYYSSKGTLILNMGKPVLLLDVIKKLINLRKKFTQNYDYSITKIGLSKGEKLVEELIINKKSVRVKNKIGILECSEPSYKFNEVQELISKIYFNLLNSKEKELSSLFSDFLKKEI